MASTQRTFLKGLLGRDQAIIREGAELWNYRCQIWRKMTDGTERAVRLAEISTLVLDYALTDGTAINSRTNQDIKNANNVTISALGEIEWAKQAEDNTIQGTLNDGELEEQVAMIVWTLTDGTIDSVRQSFFIKTDSKV